MAVTTGRNVILIVLDSARADIFASHSPNFEALTSDGASFKRAVAPAGWTLPSHASMFTGLSPTEHGICALGRPGGTYENFKAAAQRTRELKDHLVVPQLAAKGVRTFSSSSSPWLWHGSGLSAGFQETDFFYFLRAKPASPSRHGISKRARQVADAGRSVEQHIRWMRTERDKGARRVLEGIARSAAKPGRFFAFANLIETHEPHLAPRGYAKGGASRKLWELRDVALEPPLRRVLRIRAHNYGNREVPQRVLHRWKQAYAAEMRYVDDWLGRLMDRLERAKVIDDTVVIVTADHGEAFGEKGVVGHGLSTYQGIAHVPLGIWGAGIDRCVIEDPVSLTSMAATLRHLALDDPKEGSLFDPAGRGRARIEIEDPRAVIRPPRRAKRIPAGPGAAFYDGPLKLVVDPFRGRSLFDLDEDPAEENDLSASRTPTSGQEEQELAWRKRLTSNYGADGTARAAPGR